MADSSALTIFTSTTKSKTCKSLDDGCPFTMRIIEAAKYSASLLQNPCSNQTHQNELVNFCQNTYPTLLDDYIHIVNLHHHEIDKISNLFQNKDSSNTNPTSIDCDINNCQFFARNHRLTSDQSIQDSNLDDDYLFYRNILDTIHCYIFHSYDIALRVHKCENTEEIKQNVGPKQLDNDQNQYDKEFASISQSIQSTTKQLPITSQRFSINKFNINLDISSKHDGTTFVDGLYQSLQFQGIPRENIQILQEFFATEEYDTDAYFARCSRLQL